MRPNLVLAVVGLLGACGGDHPTPEEPDTTAPAVGLGVTAPIITERGGTVKLVASVSDEVGVVKVEFYGRKWATTRSPRNWERSRSRPTSSSTSPRV